MNEPQQASPASPSRFPILRIELPPWVAEFLSDADCAYSTVEDRVGLAIELARRNVREGTGGPFGAAVFECETGRLVAPGVNVVAPASWSGGHAEMVACAIAQQKLGTHDLGSEGLPRHELVTSTEPCSMCYGATPWSGVRRLVCAARAEDAEAIGFDEGPKPADWARQLEARGIQVVEGVLRDQARGVLQEYATQGGAIYNGRLGNASR